MAVLRKLHRGGLKGICAFVQWRGIAGRAIFYDTYGAPEQRIYVAPLEVPDPKDSEVLVEMLAAPINPADINQIQGVYPIKPPLPAVAGNEGFGRVKAVGANVRLVKTGQWVIPTQAGAGTWRTHGLFSENALQVLPEGISVEFAATVSVNPCTAFRMLRDFESLKPGDVVIQNAANSGVGLAVIQLAKAFGVHTINIVRNRPSWDSLVSELKQMGATEVVTEETLANTTSMQDLTKRNGWNAPRLAFNAVGGKSASDLARVLGTGGTMVTYGAMSKQPVTVPNALLIFKDLRLRGFWMSKWLEIHSAEERTTMLHEIADLHRKGQFSLPTQAWSLDQFSDAILAAQKPFQTAKQVIILNKLD